MKKNVLIVVLFLLFPISATAETPIFNHNVLIIHSYHKEMQWVEEVHRGLEKKLLGALGDLVDIKVEYMDSKRYAGEDYYNMLASVWRYKYQNNKPDCLIVCDDNALNLALVLREDLFKDIPLVFCGVNLYDPERFAEINKITGVIEAYDLPGTLEIIKKLLPDHRKLFIINDDTTTGKANQKRLEAIHYDFTDHFNFMYSGRLSISDLQESLKYLTEDSVILLMSFNRDAEGKMLRYRDAIHSIRKSSSNPIFGVWSFYLGKGIVGGSLVNGESQGGKAAELCLSILDGIPVNDLPVISVSPNLPMFDYLELERFSIPASLLPPDSRIINTPNTIWHRYKGAIIVGFALLMCQFFVIALLVYNVNKRKSSEQRLQKNQQNLAITLEAIGEGVISVNEQHKIVQANNAASKLLQIPLLHLPGMLLTNLLTEIDPAGGKQLADIIQRCCDFGENIELPGNSSLKLSGYPEKRLSGTCSPMRDSLNRIIGAVLICRDITEKEIMQAQLSQSHKLEAIGQLAGGVAHDFNNLLTGISGFAELLSLQLKGDKQKSEIISKIMSAAGRAKDLTRKLLSFARRGKIISSPVNCHKSLSSAIGLLERSIDKSISIQTELGAKDFIILGDPVQLENIFLNLGINAADSMPDGGSLTFSTTNQQILEPITSEFGDIIEPGNYLLVSVKDSGCGIEKESRQQIFEPFYTTKELGKGTGLGLPAVFGAMKEHNGRIKLISEVGVGTEFTLFFPVKQTGQFAENIVSEPIQKGSANILVIDDEDLLLSVADGLLRELGYNVLLAKGGKAGLASYQKNKAEIDLVLLDMIMPEMDGASCFLALKAINPEIKVIIYSGFAKTPKVKEVVKLGACCFLQKPYTASEISNALIQALNA